MEYWNRIGAERALNVKILEPDGKVLDIVWCSPGSQMVKYWPVDGSILIQKCCQESLGQFWKRKPQTAGFVDQTVAYQKFSFWLESLFRTSKPRKVLDSMKNIA